MPARRTSTLTVALLACLLSSVASAEPITYEFRWTGTFGSILQGTLVEGNRGQPVITSISGNKSHWKAVKHAFWRSYREQRDAASFEEIVAALNVDRTPIADAIRNFQLPMPGTDFNRAFTRSGASSCRGLGFCGQKERTLQIIVSPIHTGGVEAASVDAAVAVVAPGSLGLLGFGLVLVACFARRRLLTN